MSDSKETRQEVLWLDEGPFVITFPAKMSPQDIDDLEKHIELFLRRLRRLVPTALLAQSERPE